MVNIIDHDKDGIIGENDLQQSQEALELELREEKADAHRRMAWAAMISMIVFTVALFLPIVSESRVAALADLLGLFYIAQAGVVGAYMGVTAWMSKGSSSVSASRFQAAPAPRKPAPAAEPEL
jgi:formate hydrogenlyase subunit 4